MHTNAPKSWDMDMPKKCRQFKQENSVLVQVKKNCQDTLVLPEIEKQRKEKAGEIRKNDYQRYFDLDAWYFLIGMTYKHILLFLLTKKWTMLNMGKYNLKELYGIF